MADEKICGNCQHWKESRPDTHVVGTECTPNILIRDDFGKCENSALQELCGIGLKNDIFWMHHDYGCRLFEHECEWSHLDQPCSGNVVQVTVYSDSSGAYPAWFCEAHYKLATESLTEDWLDAR